MSDLLPCPYCEGQAERDSSDDGPATWVVCTACGATAPTVEAWNRRAPSAAFRAGAAEMRERAAEQVDCGCSWRADALAATNKGERFVACGNDPCGAIEARAIRALPLPAAPEEGG